MISFSGIPDGPVVPEGSLNVGYGTSGFRANAEAPMNNMNHIAYRCGLLFASIPILSRNYPETHSKHLLESLDRHIIGLGCIITASHNPHHDNGIKLFAPSGEMIESEWEHVMNEFINTRGSIQELLRGYFYDHEGFEEHLENFRKKYAIRVLIGSDNRATSPKLVSLFKSGVDALFGTLGLDTSESVIIGKVTTPTLPFLLHCGYIQVSSDAVYLDYIETAFGDAVQVFRKMGLLRDVSTIDIHEELYYDCSFGVGGLKIWRFCNCIRMLGIHPYVCNSSIPGDPSKMTKMLNSGCGSDYVLARNTAPFSVKDVNIYTGKRFCSFDGDVDRVIYFVSYGGGKCTVFHGDHLLLIKVLFLRFLLKSCKLKLNVGIFQTRYSNGAITSYIHSLISQWNHESDNVKWHHEFFNSGVKHAQRAATKYDLSVYYEKNGHGAIVSRINGKMVTTESMGDQNGDLLGTVLNLFSPGGDAIVNSLVLELALKVLKMTVYDCLNMYTDLPFISERYKIPKNKMVCFASSVEDESILIRPKWFQEALDSKVRLYEGARAFIRPSGTENILRVYVEAKDHESVKILYNFIVQGIEKALKECQV